LQSTSGDPYATLGLDRDCTGEQIRSAYRLLARQVHPDVNGGSAEAEHRTRQLNAAYDILSDPDRRRAYDADAERERRRAEPKRFGHGPSIAQDVSLRVDEFFRGAALEVRVNDPGMAGGAEIYALQVPPETAPGTRFKVARTSGGFVNVRVKLRPDPRFKARGSDLRCDLRISPQRAAQGGTETVSGPTGTRLRVSIPRQVARGDVVRISGEGLPKPRGGRGDLLVRVVYRPEVRISRVLRR
jgi:curved DNA-binding protein